MAHNLAFAALTISFLHGVEYTLKPMPRLDKTRACLVCGKETSHKKQCCSPACFRTHSKRGKHSQALAGVVFFLLCLLSGCKAAQFPAGAQLQASSVGVEIAPQGAIGPHVTLGSRAVTITTAQPDGAPNLNRFEVEAPGTRLKSTVATGPVGEQLRAAGGPDAIGQLMHSGSSPLPSQRPALVPTPPTPLLPATNPAQSATGPALATPSPSPQ